MVILYFMSNVLNYYGKPQHVFRAASFIYMGKSEGVERGRECEAASRGKGGGRG